MAYLVVHNAGKETTRLELKGPLTIGRAVKCDLWLSDSALSREHCRVEPVAEGWWLVDLDSRNGTYIDAFKVDRRQPLHDGDTIRIGQVRIEYHAGVLRQERSQAPEQNEFAKLLEAEAAEAAQLLTRAAATPKPRPVPSPQPVRKNDRGDSSHPSPSPRPATPSPVANPTRPPSTPSPNPAPAAYPQPHANPVVRPAAPRPRPQQPG